MPCRPITLPPWLPPSFSTSAPSASLTTFAQILAQSSPSKWRSHFISYLSLGTLRRTSSPSRAAFGLEANGVERWGTWFITRVTSDQLLIKWSTSDVLPIVWLLINRDGRMYPGFGDLKTVTYSVHCQTEWLGDLWLTVAKCVFHDLWLVTYCNLTNFDDLGTYDLSHSLFLFKMT